ncbi:terminase small subunit [Clostridium zeae]|uniref:Terminase small subunit n=1 Tax=Clostridium zeae TaxID=2759022 RepID=A0ABQ1E7U1_9CLOT|nr:terminase small subunit [Clostridium zeae]GFZ30741.1 terminase small subunit [Clostridium zeae]
MAKLTAKQKAFCDEYLIDLNATQAAIRAGYSPHSASDIGCENLKKPYIKEYIDKAMAERSKRTGINQDRVLRELARLGFVNASDLIDVDTAEVKNNISRDDAAAIASIKVKITPTEDGEEIIEREVKLYNKTKSLELLGKHLGLFTEKIKIEGTVPVKIVDDIDEGY